MHSARGRLTSASVRRLETPCFSDEIGLALTPRTIIVFRYHVVTVLLVNPSTAPASFSEFSQNLCVQAQVLHVDSSAMAVR